MSKITIDFDGIVEKLLDGDYSQAAQTLDPIIKNTKAEGNEEMIANLKSLYTKLTKKPEYILQEQLEGIKENIVEKYKKHYNGFEISKILVKRAKNWSTENPRYDIIVHVKNRVVAYDIRNELGSWLRRFTQEELFKPEPGKPRSSVADIKVC